MDYSDPNAFTLPFQLTKQVRRDVYPLLEPTQPELSAKGKTVLITGVSGGIGKMQVIAESWATAGASGIVITGRNTEALESVATRLQSLAPATKVLAQSADITNEASVAALFAAAKEAVGKIDVLINSAGSLEAGLVGTAEPTKFFTDFQVNVLGTYLVTQNFLTQADGSGTVVSFTTGAIATVFPGMGGYTASKLALTRIMENLHAEQPNTRVFLLIPGIVQTAMTVDSLKPYAKDTPELSASWTLFLSTPRAEWLRGGIVSVNWDIEEMEAHKDEIVRDNLLGRAFLNAKLGKDGHPWS
ncbi:NAD(P)-binding protein [Karstenula rhodostoma CBS 690.94]|uniref:NAD(P)-binding protein n=1 Tax=Karstenula rhodostoma CBS 690.94 TaxID=1392251 RepID=A0A9P4U643_9PLEO|nr:NAD(P)-binding protein [Karstenula rhodostoma CBS 690.94]